MVFDSIRELVGPDPDLPAIAVEGLTETFRLYHESRASLKERLYKFRKSSYTDFKALEDVSFTINHGESVGIIGHNGSGKSTLLKVLARILPTDEGRVRINGRLATLLELGAGMHGDLSGRENIYLNGAILGLTESEIDDRFEGIVEFAGIRPFLDTAVRNYSSGMYVRLGFAIAVSVDPDVLLVDEVLSVGDAEFQKRSLDRMRQFTQRGKTVVIVSHDMSAMEDLCDRIIVLDQGKLVFDGAAPDGIARYQELMGMAQERARPSQEHGGTGQVIIAGAELRDLTGRAIVSAAPSSQLRLTVTVEARAMTEACSVGVLVTSPDGRSLFEVHTTWQGLGIGPIAPGQRATVSIEFTASLLAGHYQITPVVTDARARTRYDVLAEPLRLRIDPAPGRVGLVDLAARLSVTDGPALRMDAFTDVEVRSEPLRAVDEDGERTA